MKPAPFEYFAPTTVDEAISLLQAHEGEAKILAGGQSLMPLLSMRLARPSIVIDLGKLGELAYIRESRGRLAIGAMTTKRRLEDSAPVKTHQPLLHAATLLIGHPQIRNRGTIGGSLAHADPASEYPAVALALDAELCLKGPGGERTLAARDFFVTYLTTALEPSEILTEIRFPAPRKRSGWSFLEVSRRHGDFAMVGVAVLLTLNRRGRIEEARLVLFGVGATPVRASGAEQTLGGEKPGPELFERAAAQVKDDLEDPLSDVHASADYRRHLAQVLTQRGLGEAAERVGASR